MSCLSIFFILLRISCWIVVSWALKWSYVTSNATHRFFLSHAKHRLGSGFSAAWENQHCFLFHLYNWSSLLVYYGHLTFYYDCILKFSLFRPHRSPVKLSWGEMAVSFANVNSDAGLKKLDEYLLSRSYITGYVWLRLLYVTLVISALCLHCIYLLLVTKLPRMTWLSTLHFLRLPHPSTSTLQGGSVTLMHLWG
jgi:hypothetical protein